MRTTLDVDDDVLSVVRVLARQERRSVGKVLSSLARRGLRPTPNGDEDGFPLFPVSADAAVFGPDEVATALDNA